MKTIRIFSIIALFLAVGSFSFAQQVKKESLKVSGECGMCKKKIEKAAKEAGASYALWNKDSKILTIRYSSASTNSAKIQQKIAGVGYDTPDFKATDEAYNKLDQCCQYDRTTGTTAKTEKKDDACCKKEKGKTTMNCTDGKTTVKKTSN